jgi:hypothetical protein
MYCFNHPDRAALSACSSCEKMFCRECLITESGNAMFCAKCEAMRASKEVSFDVVREREDAQARSEEVEQNKKSKTKKVRTVQFGIIFIALILGFIQVPKMNSAFQQPAPQRVGDYDTEENVNKCITVLWHVSKKLQNGELPGADLFCTANEDFEIDNISGGDTVVRVAHPELYGFSEMRVSRLHPVPEVTR